MAFSVGVSKAHGNVGKKHSYNNNVMVMTPIRVFFENIIIFAEVHATRVVETFAGLDNRARMMMQFIFHSTSASGTAMVIILMKLVMTSRPIEMALQG
jgi:hypothetical protein